MDSRTVSSKDYRQRVLAGMIATRSQWPADERKQRAQWAKQLQERLWAALDDDTPEDQGVWAVGAVSAVDIMRLRGA